MPCVVMPALPFVQAPLSGCFLHKIQRGLGFTSGNCGKKPLPFCIPALPILQSGREQLVDLFASVHDLIVVGVDVKFVGQHKVAVATDGLILILF